jgi:(E)-4-hydroxy-3-methylbut-2-enyl-diphosphate synthase
VKGEIIKTVPESEIVQTLIDEANRIAADMDPALIGSSQISVSE